MRIFYLCLIFFLAACQSPKPKLPEISFPEEIGIKSSEKSVEKKWLHAMDTATKYIEESEKNIEKTREFLYPYLLENTFCLLIRCITENFLREGFLKCAVEAELFAQKKLNEKKLEKASKIWHCLITTDRKLLHASYILAELRQKWKAWIYFPKLANPKDFPNIAKKLSEMPSLEWIEERRKLVDIFGQAFRQFIKKNPFLFPPQELLSSK